MAFQQPIGAAVLHVASEVRADVREAFTAWCDSVHHRDTMRVDGFLGMRRLELVEAADPELDPGLPILTLYQVAELADADFTSPSYQRHSASYVPPPPGVVDGISFERTVYRRVGHAVPGVADAAVPLGGVSAASQLVGSACLVLAARADSPDDGPAAFGEEARRQLAEVDGVLGSDRLVQADLAVGAVSPRVALVVEVDDVEAGRRALDAARRLGLGVGCDSVALYDQVFPERGVLLRDGVLAS